MYNKTMNKTVIISLVALTFFSGLWFILKGDNTTTVEPEPITDLSENEKAKDNIIGKWQAVDDSNAVIVFEADGTQKDFYEGEELSGGTWKFTTSSIDDGAETRMLLQTVINGEIYEYEIYVVTEKSLVLNYLARGDMLVYERFGE